MDYIGKAVKSAIKGASVPVQAHDEVTAWVYVRSGLGQIIRADYGLLMVNDKGDYAIEVDYTYLVIITGDRALQLQFQYEHGGTSKLV